MPKKLREVKDPDPPYNVRLVEEVRCDKCGELLEEGAWSFCVSRRNPGGHSTKIGYGFKMDMSMKTNGWSRSKR